MLALTGSIWLEIIRNSKAQGDYKHNFASLSVKKKVWAGKEIRGRLSILSVWPDPQVCIRWNHTPIRIPSEMSIRSIVLIFQVADLYCCLPHKSGILNCFCSYENMLCTPQNASALYICYSHATKQILTVVFPKKLLSWTFLGPRSPRLPSVMLSTTAAASFPRFPQSPQCILLQINHFRLF